MYMWQFSLIQLLAASLIAGILGVSGFLLTATIFNSEVLVTLTPEYGTVVVGETFTVSIIVTSHTPTNVFKGILEFDTEKLAVSSIDYNTSIADLWAEEPWYNNGDGTISFIGGTTKPGGFVGSGALITVTFTSKATGDTTLSMSDMRVLKHDGSGTEASLPTPIDAIFTVSTSSTTETIFSSSLKGPDVQIVATKPHTDLNNDGKRTMADISIFMTDLITKNLRSDFSGDGKVTLDDLKFLTE